MFHPGVFGFNTISHLSVPGVPLVRVFLFLAVRLFFVSSTFRFASDHRSVPYALPRHIVGFFQSRILYRYRHHQVSSYPFDVRKTCLGLHKAGAVDHRISS